MEPGVKFPESLERHDKNRNALEVLRGNRVGLASGGIARRRGIASFFPDAKHVEHISNLNQQPDVIAGWGLKSRYAPAMGMHRPDGAWYLALEDGFLRSYGLGVDGEDPVSIVLDDEGIYFDAHRPSRLRRILEDTPPFSQALRSQAERFIEAMNKWGLGKYNNGRPVDRHRLSLRQAPLVIVIDQTAGDDGVTGGDADGTTFRKMLNTALAENPGADVRVRTHPDVVAGKRRGYLYEHARSLNVPVIADNQSWPELCRYVSKVYTATSQAGLEALLRGVTVVTFGRPFYAGWGLTDDRVSMPDRTTRHDLTSLAAACYLLYPRYIDPVTQQPCSAMDTAERIADRRERALRNCGTIHVGGIRRWKRPHVAPFLEGADVRFHRSAKKAAEAARDQNGHALIWGSRVADALQVADQNTSIMRMEDGFLRSRGLGSDCVPATSLVLDRAGMYYDPRTPGEIARILQEAPFDKATRARGAALRKRIVEAGVTKYNLAEPAELEDIKAIRSIGHPVVLVAGQVPDDASIRLGTQPPITDDASLVARARSEEPRAYLVYKPHPDVLSGNRKDHGDMVRRAREQADRVVESGGMDAVLRYVDRVHVMTSLSGLEALLRGVEVVTHGRPFYAGYGVTTDRVAEPKCSTPLSVEDLVVAAFIRYPMYHDWDSGYPCHPEDVVRRFGASDGADYGRDQWLVRLLRRGWNLVRHGRTR